MMRHKYITFTLDQTLPLQNEWQRWHWRKRGRYIQGLAWLVMEHFPWRKHGWYGPLESVKITITRVSNWRGIAPDVDAVCVKPLLDVMQPRSKRHPYGLGIIADDSQEVVKSLVVNVEKGEARTIVEINEA